MKTVLTALRAAMCRMTGHRWKSLRGYQGFWLGMCLRCGRFEDGEP